VPWNLQITTSDKYPIQLQKCTKVYPGTQMESHIKKTKRNYTTRCAWEERNGKIYLNRKVEFKVPQEKFPNYVLNLYARFVASKNGTNQYSTSYAKSAMMLLQRYKLVERTTQKKNSKRGLGDVHVQIPTKQNK